MDYMKPIQTTEVPTGENWFYEVKYDGFRAQLQWKTNMLQLISRNGHNITALFPEIIAFCREHQSKIQSLLPVTLDGELTVLNHTYQANFALIQKRGRLKKTERIKQTARNRPASFLAFDILQHQATSLKTSPFSERKEFLQDLFTVMGLAGGSNINRPLGFIPAHTSPDELWKTVTENKAEGMIAKRKESIYHTGKQHHDWFKIKNWRQVEGFLTFYHVDNGYYTVHVYKDGDMRSVGKCRHGLSNEEEETLKALFTTKGTKQKDGYMLPPAVCARINTLDLYKNELREPNFAKILPNHN
ncbi:MAG TPA: non-homologous end-joining DNA ligase, partial [Bacillota bacterium]|nr:non-homologous end-joining DNA ligase [Bacillota bacterium]